MSDDTSIKTISGHSNRTLTILVAALLTAMVPHVSAVAEDKSNFATIPAKDPEMLAAAAKAQAGLDEFLARLENPPEGATGFAVKLGFIDQGDQTVVKRDGQNYLEYMWVNSLRKTGTNYVGILNNDPETVANIKSGQEVNFSREDIFDWTYKQGGKVMGNATACPLLRQGPKEQLDYYRTEYGLDC